MTTYFKWVIYHLNKLVHKHRDYKMCLEIPRGYSRKRENVKVLTNSGEQRGQDQNDKNTTLKTKKQMNNMDPTKKLGVDSGAPEE